MKLALGLPDDPESLMLQASRSYLDAKAIATLTYLHNGKLDYPARNGVGLSCRDRDHHCKEAWIYGGRQIGSNGANIPRLNPDITV